MMQTSNKTNRVAGSLWAITCYFNPFGYKQKLANYRTFRQLLEVPLITVELSYDTNFHLQTSDANILIQLCGQHVLWQKERLLNLALKALPNNCDKVAWLDCDILFQEENWIQLACKALERYVLIQPYVKVCDLKRHADSSDLNPAHAFHMRESMASQYVAETINFAKTSTSMLNDYSPGHAWVIRRDVIEQTGLYDGMILGSGDFVIAMAAIGRGEDIISSFKMNWFQSQHYRRWARKFYEAINSNLGVINGNIYHLWHGDFKDRKYQQRQKGLRQFNFDPFTDIAVDKNGCWQWNTDKHDLHQYVKAYFASRNEDGFASVS